MGIAQRNTAIETEPLYTEAQYLALERAAEERHEYLDGMIYTMAGESPEHGSVSVNLVRLIGNHLLGKDCDLYTKDTKVRSGPLPKNRLSTKGLYSYPDLVVVCGERKYLDEHRDVLINPTVIIEVVSDSTEEFDRRQKFLRYQQYLPLLADYVLVAQKHPMIEVFHRPSPKSPQWEYTAISGLKGQIVIPALNCTLRLAQVYYRVTFPSEESAKPASPRATPRRKKTLPAKSQPATTRKRSKGR